jgi:hypothetical protein
VNAAAATAGLIACLLACLLACCNSHLQVQKTTDLTRLS